MREPEFSHAMHAWVVVGANQLITITAQIQSLWLPAIQAQLVLDRKNSAAAPNTLQAASAIELGTFSSPPAVRSDVLIVPEQRVKSRVTATATR
jgi:hypothetical protein